MNGVNRITDLPIFHLTGATGVERWEFGRRLITVCARRSISATLVRRDLLRENQRYALQSLARQHDLVLVDAGFDFPTHTIQICGHGQSLQDSLVWCGGNELEMQTFVNRLVDKLNGLVHQVPVWACLLIGGKSSRMGRPKHLIEDEQKTTWLERTINLLLPWVDGLVVSGAGKLPEKFAGIIRLADIPGVAGPMAGILAACRWQPMVTWLLVACDMPHISREALQWLLADRHAGCWGRVPRLAENKFCEPLLAWYDFRAGQLFEEQLYDGNMRIGVIASHPKIENPVVPDSLRYGWQNINSPEQLPGTATSAGS